MKESFLFVMDKPPVSGIAVQETLDIILTMAAFDRRVTLLFLDDGVFELKKEQRPEVIGLKDTALMFQALPLYEVNDLIVEVESLEARGLGVDDLILPVQLIRRDQVGALLNRQEVLFGV